MNQRSKICLDSIEKAHRALDALPEHRPQEVTKTQAIQRLIVPIRASQSRGYSLAAIGKVLSECGIPITTGALRAYVSEAEAGTGGRGKHKPKRAPKTPKKVEAGAATPGQDATPAPPTTGKAKPAVAAAARNVDLEWESAARSDRAAPSSGSQSRPGFAIRPDTKDI